VLGASAGALWRYLYDLDMAGHFVRLEFSLTLTDGFAINLFNCSDLFHQDAQRDLLRLAWAPASVAAS